MVANQQTTPAPVMVEPTKSYFSTTFTKMFSAGTAASIAEITTIPIDTAKVRLQVGVSALLYNPASVNYFVHD